MTKLTAAEHRRRGNAGQSKYRNQRCEYDGYKFASRREMLRYCDLVKLQAMGKIRSLELQPGFILNGVNGPLLTDRGRKMEYRADFRYFDVERGQFVIEDSKGARTPLFKLKKAIMRNMGFEVIEV